MVPTVEFPPAIPFTIQLTAVLVVPVTLIVMGIEFPTRTVVPADVWAVSTTCPGATFTMA